MTGAVGARDFTPLGAITVLEHADALSVAACAHLLARLGARVIRLETPDETRRLRDANAAERRLRTAHKERHELAGGDWTQALQPWLPAADAVPSGASAPQSENAQATGPDARSVIKGASSACCGVLRAGAAKSTTSAAGSHGCNAWVQSPPANS